MNGTRVIGPRGLSKGEQAIMDRHDAGADWRCIARELGVSPAYVAQVIGQYSFASCWGTGDSQVAAIRAGCARYTAALAATGKRYV